ncbi:MAG: CPBP family intramembrane metalloprotease [Chloroflexi bacterium]|nr:CPBP family intramembrane metalloprotease [Chloroflexota bacterium]
MNDNFTLSISQRATRLFNPNKRGYLIGLLAVFVPFVIVGLIGESLGTDTSFASGLVITFTYLLAIVIATAVLKSQGSGWQEIGLARPKSWPKTIVMALGAMVAFVAAMIIVQIILMNIPGIELQASDQSDYNPLTGNLPMFLILVVTAWTSVAFGEEMLFRAFLTVSLAGTLGDLKARWALALAGSSLAFGLAHFSWGPAGMIETAIMGFVLGFIYLRSGRNLWITIIAHALANTIKFSLIYAGAV